MSEFAGAAEELTDALLVNPYDIETVADAIYRAIRMPSGEKTARMERMQDHVQERDIYCWVRGFFEEVS